MVLCAYWFLSITVARKVMRMDVKILTNIQSIVQNRIKVSIYLKESDYINIIFSDLVDLLKKNQRRQKLRFVRYPSQLGNRPIKIAGIEVPSLGTIKNNTLTLHLPIPFNQPGNNRSMI